MCTACEYGPRRFPAKEPVPEYRALALPRAHIAKCRARKPRTVEESLEIRRHSDPPYGVDDNEMVRGMDELLETLQVWFKLLHPAIPFMQYRIKSHLANVQPLYRVPSVARAFLICICERAAQAACIGMTEENKDFFAGHALILSRG